MQFAEILASRVCGGIMISGVIRGILPKLRRQTHQMREQKLCAGASRMIAPKSTRQTPQQGKRKHQISPSR
jgi:hypothetical protein